MRVSICQMTAFVRLVGTLLCSAGLITICLGELYEDLFTARVSTCLIRHIGALDDLKIKKDGDNPNLEHRFDSKEKEEEEED